MIDLSLGQVRIGDAEPLLIEPQARYGLPGGTRQLREAIAARHGVSVEQVTVTTGASLGLVATLASLPTKGAVLLPRPFYPAFPRVTEMLGFTPTYYDVRAAGDRWAADLDQVHDLLGMSPVAMLWNHPHNPTGALDSDEDMAHVLEWASRSGTLVITDRVYCDIVYDGISPGVMGPPHPSEVRLHSFSKTYTMAGERLGYAITKPPRIAQIERAHWSLAMSAPAAAQSIAVRALEDGAEPQRLLGRLRELRAAALRAIRAWPKLETNVPDAGIFLWIGLPGVTSPSKVVADLCRRAGALVVPGAEFGLDGTAYLRISFAVPEDELVRGLQIVGRVGTAFVERSRPLDEVEQVAVGVDEVLAERARGAGGG